MALTLNNLWGGETRGLEEFSATVNSPDPTETTIVRSGSSALSMDGASTQSANLPLFDYKADAGTGHVFGFGVYLGTDVTPSSAVVIGNILNDAAGIVGQIELQTDGTLHLLDSLGAVTVNGTVTLKANTHHFIEVYFVASATGASAMNVDGNSGGTDGTSNDFDNGTLDEFQFAATSALDGVIVFCDWYWYSGSTAKTEMLGHGFSASLANQAGLVSKISDIEDDLSSGGGNWSSTGQRPWVDLTDAQSARFEDTGNLQGAVFFDVANASGAEGGPAFGSSLIGIVKGAKWMFRADRGSGGGRTHTLYYGSDNDTDTTLAASNSIASIAGPTGTTPENFFAISESATLVPAATDNFAMGAGKSATGGQDTYPKEMMACLAVVYSTTVTDLSDGEMPEYPSPGLTVEV